MRRITALVALAVAGALVLAAPVGAEPYAEEGISLSTTTPTSPGSFTVTIDGCRPNSPASVTLGSGDAVTATADANGVASADVDVPAGLDAGSSQTVTATCTDVAGAEVAQTATITVASKSTSTDDPASQAGGGSPTALNDGSGESLAETGSDSLPLAALGGVLVALGAGAWFLARRRLHRA